MNGNGTGQGGGGGGGGGGRGSKLVIYACAKVPMGFTLISLRKFAALGQRFNKIPVII